MAAGKDVAEKKATVSAPGMLRLLPHACQFFTSAWEQPGAADHKFLRS